MDLPTEIVPATGEDSCWVIGCDEPATTALAHAEGHPEPRVCAAHSEQLADESVSLADPSEDWHPETVESG